MQYTETAEIFWRSKIKNFNERNDISNISLKTYNVGTKYQYCMFWFKNKKVNISL